MSYLASKMQPSSCCSSDQKCPKSHLAWQHSWYRCLGLVTSVYLLWYCV